MMDSIIAANSGAAAATPTGPRRIVIPSRRRSDNGRRQSCSGRAVADSLRRMLRPRPKQFTIVDPDSVRLAVEDVARTSAKLDKDAVERPRRHRSAHGAAARLRNFDLSGHTTSARFVVSHARCGERARAKERSARESRRDAVARDHVPRRDEPRAAPDLSSPADRLSAR